VARKKLPPIDDDAAKQVGRLLRSLRRTAGYRAVEQAAGTEGCPAARQTIYLYERGDLVPSLQQFLDLVEFYALKTPGAPAEIRHEAVAAVVTAISLPAYHLTHAMALIARLNASWAANRGTT
jgi:DNA-binding XRE family transcriptional regulator